MKTIIIYKSKTGFTKHYAELIAKETGSDICSLKELRGKQLSEYERVVYGGRLFAGMIDGLNKIKEQIRACSGQKLVVFATGATPNAAGEVIEEVWKNNFSEEEREIIPHFYMQAGICYEKMGVFDKMILKMAAKMMKKKDSKTEVEEGFAEALRGSFDISSDEYAKEVIQYLNKC